MQLNMTGLYTKLYAITDHTPCDVDTPKRFGAYILDWVVGGIFTGLPAVLLYSGLTKKQDMFGGLYVFESLGYARSWAFLPGHSAFCLRCFIMYMFHGVSGRGRHLENVLPVTAWKKRMVQQWI